jgi:hypothetical protein
VSSATPGPLCPRCRRPIAAWRLEHCVYCGESFPPDLKEGHSEPEALKWVERPPIPIDAAKQLEMMKVIPWGEPKAGKRSRPALLVAGVLTIGAFVVIFVLLYLLMRRSAPSIAAFVLVIGTVFLGYLASVFLRVYRRGTR